MKEKQEFIENTLDYKKIFHRLYAHRTIYIVLASCFLVLAFLINKYTIPVYINSTTLYMNQNDKSSNVLNTSDMFQNLGFLNVNENIDNELEMIRSFSLVKKVVSEADLKVSYYSRSNSPFSDLFASTPFVRKYELYKQSPIEVAIDPSVPQVVYLNFYVTFLNETEFMIEADGESLSLYDFIDDEIKSTTPAIHFKQRYRFGDEIKTKYFNFRIQKTANFDKDFTSEQKLYFFLNDINNLTLAYQGALSTETSSEKSTLIRISLTGTSYERITDFLNDLSSTYLGKSLDKKNKTALSTIDFIDSQISNISDSLSYAESALKNFRTSQGVMDLSFQGQQIFEQLGKLEEERSAIQMQKKYYEYLSNYLAHNEEFSNITAPGAMNVVDPIMNGLVSQLISMSTERASLLRNNNSQQNLFLADLNIRIENVKNTIKETVKNTLNTLNISSREIDSRMSRASGQISQMPKTELQLKGIERKFDLNDAIFTFLLQKRAEAQIARASSIPDYEVVDAAVIATTNKIRPKKMLNFIIALFLAFVFPTSVILAKDFLNNKVMDPDEIENFSIFPVIGKVYHNFHRAKTVVHDHPNSSVTESFRAIRTNFQFFSEGGKRQVILVTSSTSGEGKTFCSINLATAFALNGHRTVILEFDLRRPKIHQEFGSTNIIGISSYLIDKAIIEDIIVPTHIENMDLISAGPAAPNPAELINSDRTGELIDKLKEMYDYIIIDSAPAGILAETHLLMKYADLNIFVVRLEYTVREMFRNALQSLRNNNFSNVSLLINDLNIKRDAQKYGYNTHYYTDDKSSGFFLKLFKKKK